MSSFVYKTSIGDIRISEDGKALTGVSFGALPDKDDMQETEL